MKNVIIIHESMDNQQIKEISQLGEEMVFRGAVGVGATQSGFERAIVRPEIWGSGVCLVSDSEYNF